MFKLFEKESIIAYLLYSVLLLLLGVKVFNTGILDTNTESSSLLTSILKVQEWNHILLRGVVFFTLLLSLFISSLIYVNFSYHIKAGLVFQFVLCAHFLIAFMFPFSLEQTMAACMFLIMFTILIQVDQKKETVATFYNLGFLFTLSIGVSIGMLFYMIPLLFAILIYGKTGVQDLLALILGIGTPLCIFASIILISGQYSIFIELFGLLKVIQYDLAQKWEWLIVGIGVLSALITFSSIASFTIHTRKFYTYLFFCFLTIMPLYTLLSIAEQKMNSIVMLIASFYLLPFLFQIRSYRIKNFLLFFGLIISIFATFVQFK